jgi:L-fuconolactonase
MQGRVDSHCHLWRLDRGDYGWLDANNPKLAPIARDFDVADLTAPCVSAGITQTIVIQAAPTTDESDYMLSLASDAPLIAGVVGWVDLSSADAVRQIQRLGENTLFKGIRPMLQDIADVDWITTMPRADAMAALKSSGLRFDALVLPQHLKPFLRFAQAHPDLPIVIDHAAKPALAASADDPRHDMWREGMQRLAKETSACCKISGLLTEMSARQCEDPEAVLQPVIDDLLEWFGPKRLMWGSDWPVLTLAATHADWTTLSEKLLSGLDRTAQAQIFASTARAFYGLEPAT